MSKNILQVSAPAKLNLYLEVLGRQADGYHKIRTIMQSLSLADQLTIIIGRGKGAPQLGINSHLDDQVSTAEDNLVIKAVHLLREKYDVPALEIILDKNIPAAAGLGGGSADAAAVLHGLNQMLDLEIPLSELEFMGQQLGLDVPFCLRGGTVLAEGAGEKLTSIGAVNGCCFLLVKPDVRIDTGAVYQGLNLSKGERWTTRTTCENKFHALQKGIAQNDFFRLAAGMYNHLEEVVIARNEKIKGLKECLKSTGALNSIMSGSGSTVYGLFASLDKAKQAQTILKHQNYRTYLAFPVPGGKEQG